MLLVFICIYNILTSSQPALSATWFRATCLRQILLLVVRTAREVLYNTMSLRWACLLPKFFVNSYTDNPKNLQRSATDVDDMEGNTGVPGWYSFQQALRGTPAGLHDGKLIITDCPGLNKSTLLNVPCSSQSQLAMWTYMSDSGLLSAVVSRPVRSGSKRPCSRWSSASRLQFHCKMLERETIGSARRSQHSTLSLLPLRSLALIGECTILLWSSTTSSTNKIKI